MIRAPYLMTRLSSSCLITNLILRPMCGAAAYRSHSCSLVWHRGLVDPVLLGGGAEWLDTTLAQFRAAQHEERSQQEAQLLDSEGRDLTTAKQVAFKRPSLQLHQVLGRWFDVFILTDPALRAHACCARSVMCRLWHACIAFQDSIFSKLPLSS